MLDAAATLGDLHRRNLRLRADAPALIFEDRRISHRELIGEACRLANALIRLGVQRGDRVAILAENCPQYMQVYAAGELAGWTTVTINYRLAAPEIAYILADSRPRFVIVDAAYADRLGSGRLDGVQNVLTFGGEGPDLSYEDDPRQGRSGTAERRCTTGGHRPPDLHQRHDRAAQRRDAEPSRAAAISVDLGDRAMRRTDRPARARHAVLPHRGQEPVALPFAARLPDRSASRLSSAGILSFAARARGDGDPAGADHAQRPARRRDVQPANAARSAEDLLLGGADAGGAAAPRP